MKKRSAIKNDLFASEHHREKIDRIGDPLAEIEQHINFSALAAEVDCIAPRVECAQGGRPPYPTETMVRILVHAFTTCRMNRWSTNCWTV